MDQEKPKKMDKYEFNIKIEQLKKLVDRGDYKTALEVADTIDWHRVRTASLLSMAAEVYEKNGEYQQAKDILLLAFEQAPIGKRLLYKLADLALKEGSIAEAEAYYREFCDLAPDDSRQYLLRYQILKAKNAPTEQLIRTLEAYTSLEVDEKWLYELAELYHEAGRQDECVATCDKIMLMFGLGQYVDAAMELKLEYQPLSSYQMDLVENRDKYEARLKAVEEGYGEEESADTPRESIPVSPAIDVTSAEVMRMEEDAQSAKLAEEMSRITGETAGVTYVEEENPLEKTKTLDDLHSIRGIGQTVSAVAEAAKAPGPVEVIAETTVETAGPDAAAETVPEAGDGLSDGEIEADSGEAYVGNFVDKIEEEKARIEAEEQKKIVEAREIERQRAAIKAAKAREEEEANATRSLEKERALAQKEEDERRAKLQAKIDAERAANSEVRTVTLSDEAYNELEPYEGTSNNLMIEADTPDEGFEITVELLRDIHRGLGTKSSVAKISSEKLNKRGISQSAAKLAGKDLVIEDAAGLTDALQNELDELMEKDRSGMIVVLIDTKDRLEELYERNTALAEKFRYVPLSEGVKDRIKTENEVEEAIARETAAQEKELRAVIGTVEPDVTAEPEPLREPDEIMSEPEPAMQQEKAEMPAGEDDGYEMDIDEFAQYACKYASEIDCSITGKSLLALYERIEMMEEDGVKLTKDAAVDLIEEAADKAEKPSIGKRITGLFSAKYNKEGLLILHENDFFD